MEEQGSYITEIEEAKDMLGKGYDEPSVVIERPRVVAERQPNGEFVERTIPAYVKYSTEFKAELKNITGSELKVWTYIILSIDENGVAFPGIRTIAEAIGVSHQTVITAIEGLEKKNLLHVVRGEKRYNLYQPSDEYVAIFDKNPMSQKIRPVKKAEQMSQVLSPDESNGLDLNKTLNNTKQNTSLEWQIAHGLEVTQEMIDKATLEKNAPIEFERALGFGTLPWSSNSTWVKFQKFIVKLYSVDPSMFQEYKTWRDGDGKYKAFSNKKIRENPLAFMDTGYPEFEASKMYSKSSAPAIDVTRVEETRAYNDQRWSTPFAPPPVNLTKPVLKQPERRARR